MKLYVDDVRPTPPGFDVRAETAQQAIYVLQTMDVTEISLDHDLGPPEAGTGYEIACWIEKAAYEKRIKPLSRMSIHSANPVGVANIQRALDNARRYWSGIID